MNYSTIQRQYKWIKYNGQSITNVTYVYVLNQSVSRLRGTSDILYIGKTVQPICSRYNQGTNTNNTPRNTQNTNIRMTHILRQINMANVTCYFTQQMDSIIDPTDPFLRELAIWDKKYYLSVSNTKPIRVTLEKHLIVTYATDHYEIPPLNNKM